MLSLFLTSTATFTAVMDVWAGDAYAGKTTTKTGNKSKQKNKAAPAKPVFDDGTPLTPSCTSRSHLDDVRRLGIYGEHQQALDQANDLLELVEHLEDQLNDPVHGGNTLDDTAKRALKTEIACVRVRAARAIESAHFGSTPQGDLAKAADLAVQASRDLPLVADNLNAWAVVLRAQNGKPPRSRVPLPAALPDAATTSIANLKSYVEDMMKGAHYKQASEAILVVLQGDDAERADALRAALGGDVMRVLVRARCFDAAMDEIRYNDDKIGGVDNAAVGWLRLKAWALARMEKSYDAALIYDAAANNARKGKNASLAAELCFLGGFSRYDASRYREAKDHLINCLPSLKNTTWYEQALWYSGFAAYLDDDTVTAQQQWILLADKTDEEGQRARYWLAKLRADGLYRDDTGQKLPSDGGQAMIDLAAAFPTTYYGMMARLHQGQPAFPDPADKKSVQHIVEKTPLPKKAQLLWNLGFDDEAQAVVEQVINLGVLPNDNSQKITKETATAWRLVVGSANYLWRNMTPGLPDTWPPQNDAELLHWQGAHPIPWAKHVLTECAKKNIDAGFVYAIMRTESGFRPAVVSPAAARGLLQMLPAVAVDLSADIANTTDSPAKIAEEWPIYLDQPLPSIALGTSLIAEELQAFGHPLLAAAAYNAGEEATQRWLREFGTLAPDVFVERIPYRETRLYVKRTLTDAAIYRAVWGFPAPYPTLPTQMPAAPEFSRLKRYGSAN